MIIKTIKLLFKNNASETEKDFQGLNDTLDDTAKANENVNKSFDKGATFAERYGEELQPLTTRMGEAEDRLYELALAGDTTSKEYQELIAEVGRLRKVQIETDLAVDGASKTFAQKLAPALNGVTSGFAVTQGAMALFGKENEALEESLLKVQSALAIQQGVQGLTEAYKELSIGTRIASVSQKAYSLAVGTTSGALKVFRLALISTGIGAIVVGIGLLIANFEKVSKFVGDAVESFDKLGGVMKIILLPITAIIEGFKLVQKGLQAIGVLESEEEKARKARQEAQIAREQKLLELQLARAKQARQNADAARNANISLEQLLEKQGKGEEARLRKRERLNKELNEAIFNFDSETQDKIRIQLIELDEEEAQILKDKQDRYREYRDFRLQIARQIEDLENQLLEDGIEKEIEINADKFRRLREDAERNIKLTAQERKTLIDLFTQQEKQSELEIRQKFYDQEKAQAQELIDFNEQLRLKEIEDNKAKNLAILEANKVAYEKQKELDKKAKEDAIALNNAKVDLSVQGLQLIANIAETFAGDDVKRQKRAFKIKKVADIASATVDGYRAVLSTYAQTPGGPVIKGIAAGIAGSFAALQIANIAKQQFQGGEGAGSLGSDAPSGEEAVAPQFNVVGDSGINQLAQLQQQPLQAYVVSGEVTTSQALDRNRVENATL
tara:strand:- start:4905 stop:6923 length:2019 start_codon:yes stop_codon:yes gene_type:complete